MGILGTLLGGLAGLAVGIYFGPTLAALGFTVGASIGASVSAGDQSAQGPRLNDLRTTGASFGDPISRIYGTIRLPVQIIWSSGLIEKKDVETEGGGLFSSGTEITTFKYKAHIACLICEGEIEGVRRIWMNGKLAYTRADDSSADGLIASVKYTNRVTIYTGSETQDPDPFLEEQIGTGLVPAHRGMAYMVIRNLRLKQFFNRIPNIEVEVVKSSTPTDPPSIVHALDEEVSTGGRHSARYDAGTILYAYTDTTGLNSKYQFDHIIQRLDLHGNVLEEQTFEVRRAVTTSGSDITLCANDPSFVHFINFEPGSSSNLYYDGVLIASKTFATSVSGAPLNTDDIDAYGNKEHTIIKRSNGRYFITIVDGKGLVRYVADSAGRPTYNYDKAEFLNDIMSPEVRADAVQHYIHPDAENQDEFWYHQPGVGTTHSYSLMRFDVDFNILASWSRDGTGIYNGDQAKDNFLIGPGYMLVKASNSSNVARLYTFDHETSDSVWTLVNTVNLDNSNTYSSFIPITDLGIMSRYEVVTRHELVPAAGQNLSDVVSAECLEAGYTAGQIDVTGLTGTVRGFRIPRPTSARASIEQLQKVKYFDGSEIDDKLTWIMRGGASVVTVPESELSAHTNGSALPELLTMNRGSELELPNMVTVNHLDANADYEQGSQYARRLVTTANGKAVDTVDVVLTPDEAAQAADVLLYNAHQEKERFEISLSEAYQYLVPTDVITIPVDGENVLVRITDQTQTQDGVITYKVVPEHVAIYTQSRTGADSGVTIDGEIGINGATLLAFMDIPILTDNDDNVGIYAGVAGFLTSWASSDLYKYSELSAAYSQIGSFVDEATAGIATVTLADHESGTIDYTNTLTVRPANSGITLTSSTEDAVVQDGSVNRFALGRHGTWEILQFITATDNGDGTWDLDGLLRGRRGTAYATSTHATSDYFVMLSTEWILRLIMSSDLIDVEQLYKIVGADESIDETQAFARTIEGVSKLPFFPAHVWAERETSPQDWTVEWIHHTRLNADIASDVTVDDDTEVTGYTLDIMNGAAIARSTGIDVGTETYTYATGDQFSDFGSLQSSLVVRVYQIGSTVGEGHGMEYDSSDESTTIIDPKA